MVNRFSADIARGAAALAGAEAKKIETFPKVSLITPAKGTTDAPENVMKNNDFYRALNLSSYQWGLRT